ncbi:hypothetical protein TNCV_1418521 [Trichonephila clavipes]|nr:hypothetical protein TNCV_1418521 [Trichonephila clavipes]
MNFDTVNGVRTVKSLGSKEMNGKCREWQQPNQSKKSPSLIPEHGEIGNVIEEVVDLVREINLGADNDNVQELLDSRNEERTIDKLIEMQEKEELESLRIQFDQMTVGNLTEGLNLNKKAL